MPGLGAQGLDIQFRNQERLTNGSINLQKLLADKKGTEGMKKGGTKAQPAQVKHGRRAK
jgi:hypothetical protein